MVIWVESKPPRLLPLIPNLADYSETYFFLRSLALVSDTTLWFDPRLNDLLADALSIRTPFLLLPPLDRAFV